MIMSLKSFLRPYYYSILGVLLGYFYAYNSWSTVVESDLNTSICKCCTSLTVLFWNEEKEEAD